MTWYFFVQWWIQVCRNIVHANAAGISINHLYNPAVLELRLHVKQCTENDIQHLSRL